MKTKLKPNQPLKTNKNTSLSKKESKILTNKNHLTLFVNELQRELNRLNSS